MKNKTGKTIKSIHFTHANVIEGDTYICLFNYFLLKFLEFDGKRFSVILKKFKAE